MLRQTGSCRDERGAGMSTNEQLLTIGSNYRTFPRFLSVRCQVGPTLRRPAGPRDHPHGTRTPARGHHPRTALQRCKSNSGNMLRERISALGTCPGIRRVTSPAPPCAETESRAPTRRSTPRWRGEKLNFAPFFEPPSTSSPHFSALRRGRSHTTGFHPRAQRCRLDE